MDHTLFKHLRKDDPINNRLMEQAYGSDINHNKIKKNSPINNNVIPEVKNWLNDIDVNIENYKNID